MWDNLLSPGTPGGGRAGTGAAGAALLVMQDAVRHLSHMRFLSATFGHLFVCEKRGLAFFFCNNQQRGK